MSLISDRMTAEDISRLIDSAWTCLQRIDDRLIALAKHERAATGDTRDSDVAARRLHALGAILHGLADATATAPA